MKTGDDSDALGEIAENLAKAMALRAGLLAGSISPDRTAKDLILEERLSDMNGLDFDTRSGPRICVVQVKATRSSSPRATLALSAAERLAKEPNAAAILVLRMNDDRECEEAFLIHLHGDRLDAVLKRLRMETKRRTRDLHKRKISFAPKAAERIAWNPAGLHEAFVNLFPAGISEYVADKSRWVATTGYEADRYLINFKVDGTSDELAEGFIGLRKLQVRAVEMFERRFDIDLPLPPDERGLPSHVTITPQPREAGRLILKDATSGERLEISCEVVAPPTSSMEFEDMRILFRWRMGQFVMAAQSWHYAPSENCDAGAQNTIADWLLHVRTVEMLDRRRIDIEYIGGHGTLSFTGRDSRRSRPVNRYRPVIRTLEMIDTLLKEAGNADEPTSLTALWNQRRLVELIGDFRQKSVRFTCRSGPMPFPAVTDEDGLHIGATQIGNTWMAIAMPMKVSAQPIGEEVEWIAYRSGKVVLEALQDGEPETFDRFRIRAQRLSASQVVFIQHPGSYLGDETTLLTDGIEARFAVQKSSSGDALAVSGQ